MTATTKTLLDFLALSERLKTELRHSWLSDGRQELVAEHSWQMALMAMLLHPHLETPVDLFRTVKMILVHDLVEAEVGDIPFFEKSARKDAKAARERDAIDNIRARLGRPVGEEFHALWHEFEDRRTPEAKFAGALDNLEVQVQHNLASLDTWDDLEFELAYNKMQKHCAHDPFLVEFCEAVMHQSDSKLRAAGIDPEPVRQRAQQGS